MFSSAYSGEQVETLLKTTEQQHGSCGITEATGWYRVACCKHIAAMPQTFILKVESSWNYNPPSMALLAIVVAEGVFKVKTLTSWCKLSTDRISMIRCVRIDDHCYIDVHLTNQRNELHADMTLHKPDYAFAYVDIELAPVGGDVVAEYELQFID